MQSISILSSFVHPCPFLAFLCFQCYFLLFSVVTSHVIKNKIVTIQWKKSRLLDTIDDWYTCVNNLGKNQVSAVLHSHAICRSVSPTFIELCMETPCLCPSEEHKHGGRKVTVTSVIGFCYWNAKFFLKSSDTLKEMLLLVQALFS